MFDLDQEARSDEAISLGHLPKLAVQPTGSNFTVDPPVENTDVDYLVLVEDLDETGEILAGWNNCLHECMTADDTQVSNYAAEMKDGTRFGAYRHGKINLIITDDKTFYIRSVAATFLCKALNVHDKQARIELFRAVKFGEDYKLSDLL